MQKRPVLIGFAIDLSGSMEQSIRHRLDEQISKVDGVREAFKQFLCDAQQLIQENRRKDIEDTVKVFLYGFGLQLPDKEVCDLLTLLKIEQGLYAGETASASLTASHDSGKDGYQKFERVARNYGYEESLISFTRNYLTASDADKLADELANDQSSADKLTRLLPKTMTGAAMKYGFTKGMNAFSRMTTGMEFVKDDFKEAKTLAFKLIARADNSSVGATRERILMENKQRLSNQIAEIGDVTMSIEELIDKISERQNDDNQEEIKYLIYGNTPMRKAFEIIEARFERERKLLPPAAAAFLFILSDGEPTDGSPLVIASDLKKSGVTIISCFVTDEDVMRPRLLYREKESDWKEGAKLMFDISSMDTKNSEMIQFLKERKWTLPLKSKLFVQINHSEILEEFLQALLNMIKSVPKQKMSTSI